MKINKLAKTAITLITVISMGGGYNLNEVYASENTSTISIEDPYNLFSSYIGSGTYQNGKQTNIKAEKKPTETFENWSLKNNSMYTESGISSINFNARIAGSKIYAANRAYAISYILNGGTASNPSSYSLESGNITLNNPIKPGYKFMGWSGTGLAGNNNTTVNIPLYSTDSKEYEAHFDLYTITIKGSNDIIKAHSYLPTEENDGHLYNWEYSGSQRSLHDDVITLHYLAGHKIVLQASDRSWITPGYRHPDGGTYGGGYSGNTKYLIITPPEDAQGDVVLKIQKQNIDNWYGDYILPEDNATTGWCRKAYGYFGIIKVTDYGYY